MPITIPKKFQILGHTILVSFDPMMKARTGNLAMVDLESNTIVMQPSLPAMFLDRTLTEQTFLHEVVHLILEYMGEHELSDNEKFVDMFAALLHQIMTTQKGVL